MAQTGFTPIALYYSSTASATPTAGNLVAGELALNNNDGRLFYKDSSNVVQVIGTKGGVGTSSTTQVLYNSSGLVVGSANMTFDGSTLTTLNSAYTGTLTGGTGVVNLGSGQIYKDASGRVGIGTASPSAAGLNITSGAAAVNAGQLLLKVTGSTGGIALTQGSALEAYLYNVDNSFFRFGTNNTERVRIPADGGLQVISSISVGNAAPTTSGAGITFPATQSASSDANTLDDYEEGTWTPTLSGWSGTYSTQVGRYTKIGRQVFVSGAVVTNASTGSFSAYPGPAGLPFAGGTGSSAIFGTFGVFSGTQNLGTSIIPGGVLDGPSNGATDSFPNMFVAGSVVSNFAATYLNAAAAVTYRFQIVYFANT
jgi:hypothetical protein